MSDYIIKYGRDDRVKYISHLDFVRLFHRAVRRAGLPFIFSQGFNPHPVMTVAQPLSVGVTSDCEYMRVGLDLDCDGDYVKAKINGALPPGYRIIAAKKVKGKEFDLSKLDRAEYITETECNKDVDVDAFLAHKELIVPKKSKSGTKDSDIRPYIYEIENLGFCDGVLTLKMLLSVGNTYNLKPQSVKDAMEKYIDGFFTGFMTVHRISMRAGEVEFLKKST